ncbi:hypothetical protein QR680_005306 [Steinernema hermaphroditum]|uniref:Hexosyltransferase n=1 Tax=Steinernema hermaphroditum TaxID=289476 RepID=A0AA39HTU7_9BILA|nr:hypothetical protein QR680_005306 [Steinernema hermaphroditum]
MRWTSSWIPFLPILVVLIVAWSAVWSGTTLSDEPCRAEEFARPVQIRKRHLNDSDVDNVIVLNETINWPSVHIQPRRFHLQRNLSFLVVVHSEIYNFDRRHELRTILSKELRQLANFDLLFATARSVEHEIQETLMSEAGEFDDIVQSYHIDNYHALPMKAHAWISYVHEHLQNSTKFVLKIDDDVSINAGLVANFLASRSHSESLRSVYCYPFKIAADKRKWSRYYLSEEEFPFPNLGVFCAGLAYTLSADLMPHLYRNLQKTRFVWLDDWYVTHALLVDVDFTIYDVSPFYLTSESGREALNRLRRVLIGDLPTPWAAPPLAPQPALF